jgi:hypothetical protein
MSIVLERCRTHIVRITCGSRGVAETVLGIPQASPDGRTPGFEVVDIDIVACS